MLAVKVKLFIGARILAQMRFLNVGEIDSSTRVGKHFRFGLTAKYD